MKRFAYLLGFVTATAIAAAPLAAQSGNGPWWDPGRTQSSGRQGQNGSVYGQNIPADGQWRAYSRDRNGNTVYVRERYDSNGSLIREYATRNIIGRYNVIDRQVLSNNNGQYGNQGTYGNQRGSYDRQAEIRRQEQLHREAEIRRQDQLRREAEIRASQNRNSNDRWDQNNGHDNGKHNGQYKNKDKNKDKGRNDRRDDHDRH